MKMNVKSIFYTGRICKRIKRTHEIHLCESNGSYTIGYDDGYVFGGHEIDVDVDSKGKMVCADMR